MPYNDHYNASRPARSERWSDRWAEGRNREPWARNDEYPGPMGYSPYDGGWGWPGITSGLRDDAYPRGRRAYRPYDANERGFFDRVSDEVASWFGDDAAQMRREDDFRGVGPRNYMRSDERIHDSVCDALTDDWAVDASGIDVEVAKGEVTLSGSVPTRWSRRRAEDCADRVSGVQHVQNNLRVSQDTSGDDRTAL